MQASESKQLLKVFLTGVSAAAQHISPQMLISQLMTFLVIATHEGEPLCMSEISKRLHMTSSTVSRNVALLSEFFSYQRKGYGLVHASTDPRNRRKKLITLTGQGIKTADEIGRLVGHKLTAKDSNHLIRVR